MTDRGGGGRRSNPHGHAHFARISQAYELLSQRSHPTATTQSFHARPRGFRPGNTQVLVACGVMIVGGCALFGVAYVLHTHTGMNDTGLVAPGAPPATASEQMLARVAAARRAAREKGGGG